LLKAIGLHLNVYVIVGRIGSVLNCQ